MQNYLITHAIENIWCTPEQDSQFILEMGKITPYQGAINIYSYLFITLRMPVQNKRFHLYNVGQVFPGYLNLKQTENTWVRCDDSINDQQVYIDLYTQRGIMLPRGNCWYIITEERALIFAVQETPNVAFRANNDKLFLRVYKNSYYHTSRKQPGEEIFLQSSYITSRQDILDIQAVYEQKKQLSGDVVCFKNGTVCQGIGLLHNQVGDWVEFMHDSSVTQVLEFSLGELKSFFSTLDQTSKLLVHKPRGLTNTIYYHDDIDIYLFDTVSNKGVYYHKNSKSAIRMVTHQDYSLPAGLVNAFIDENDFLNSSSVKVILKIKKSGYLRPLVYENNRIKELYKLPQQDIEKAMLGVSATVPVWQAAALENSQYVSIMSSRHQDLTINTVTEALGYHAVIKTVGEACHQTQSLYGQKACAVPLIYQDKSTVFEYDSDGFLLDWHLHTASEIYTTVNPRCRYVDFTRGHASVDIDEKYNEKVSQLDPGLDYRFYISDNTGNAQTLNWLDVTDEPGLFSISNNLITWRDTEKLTLVRSNKTPLVYTLQESLNDGVLIFNILEQRNWDGAEEMVEMTIPLGELDIFLNGKYLIEGIDYEINFPTVYVYNKAYLKPEGLQSITYRHTGLKQNKVKDNLETGFIRNGRVSVDHQFDLRDDRPVKLFIGGGIKTLDDVVFDEDTSTFELYEPSNGKPYTLKEYVVRIKDLTGKDTYPFREKSREIDDQVSNYLTQNTPRDTLPALSPINNKHQLYSLFLSKIISDLRINALIVPFIKTTYKDNQITEILKPYLGLYAHDCISPDRQDTSEYTTIQPHCFPGTVSLTIEQYRFVQRVIGLYAKDMTTLSGYCTVA